MGCLRSLLPEIAVALRLWSRRRGDFTVGSLRSLPVPRKKDEVWITGIAVTWVNGELVKERR